MAANAPIDTGAILALLDRTDDWHRICVEAFEQLRLL
jgi:predicted nucleic acid-binding protein